MRLSADARYCSLRVELGALDLVRLRATVHARLPRLEDRRRFDLAAPEGAPSAVLIEAGARAIVRAELLASYRAPAQLELTFDAEHPSGIRPRPLVRALPIDTRARKRA